MKRLIGAICGMLVALFWFEPFWYLKNIGFFGVSSEMVFQNGSHIGGIAYLLLISAVGLGWSWYRDKFDLALLSSIFGLFISAILALEVGFDVGYGLTVIFLTFFNCSFFLVCKRMVVKKKMAARGAAESTQ